MSNPARTERAMGRYADMIWHICLLHADQKPDAQDAFQDTFLKHLSHEKPFESDGHEIGLEHGQSQGGSAAHGSDTEHGNGYHGGRS